MRSSCRISEKLRQFFSGKILAITAFAVIMIVMGCGSGEDSVDTSYISVTNGSSGTVTVYYAWENDDCEVDQQTEIIASGDTHMIRMQTSLYGSGIFSAKKASNAFHTYDVQFNESGALPITISDGDF